MSNPRAPITAESAVLLILQTLRKRCKTARARYLQKQREYKFQDERIHRARHGAFAELITYIEELRHRIQ